MRCHNTNIHSFFCTRWFPCLVLPMSADRIHTDTRRISKLHTERPGIEPTTFLLWDCSANHCTAVLPWDHHSFFFHRKKSETHTRWINCKTNQLFREQLKEVHQSHHRGALRLQTSPDCKRHCSERRLVRNEQRRREAGDINPLLEEVNNNCVMNSHEMRLRGLIGIKWNNLLHLL